MSYHLPKLLWLLTAMTLLLGCQEEYIVTLATNEETVTRPSFLVEDRDPTRVTTVHTVRLYDQREDLIWHLRRESTPVDTGLESLRYGKVPRGFQAIVPAETLRPGAAYTLVVQGRGYGVLRFATNSKGELIPLGNQAAGF